MKVSEVPKRILTDLGLNLNVGHCDNCFDDDLVEGNSGNACFRTQKQNSTHAVCAIDLKHLESNHQARMTNLFCENLEWRVEGYGIDYERIGAP